MRSCGSRATRGPASCAPLQSAPATFAWNAASRCRPLSDIDGICFSEHDLRGITKADKLNYGTFYQANVWIVAKRPIAVRTMLGEKRVRAIGVSLDDPRAFAGVLEGAM